MNPAITTIILNNNRRMGYGYYGGGSSKEKEKMTTGDKVGAGLMGLFFLGIILLFVWLFYDMQEYDASIKDTYHRSAYVLEVYPEAQFRQSKHTWTPAKIKEDGSIVVISLRNPPPVGGVVYKDCWTDRNGSWCDTDWSNSFRYQNLTK